MHPSKNKEEPLSDSKANTYYIPDCANHENFTEREREREREGGGGRRREGSVCVCVTSMS